MFPRKAALIIAALALLLAGLACNLAEVTGGAEATPAPASIESTLPPAPTADGRAEFVYEKVTLRYDPALAGTPAGESLPAAPGDGPMPATPDLWRISLPGYPQGESFQTPVIYVARVDAYRAADERAAAELDALQELLASRADLGQPATLPYLPATPPPQFITEEAVFLDFGSGSGIRYLTQFTFDITLPNNQELIYAYQGLSADGQYFVSVLLPITHPDLQPGRASMNAEEMATFEANFDTLLAEEIAKFTGPNAARLAPTLAALDALVSGITVGP